MGSQDSLKSLTEKNSQLKQEKLYLVNLVTVAEDQVRTLQSLSQKSGNSEEFKDFAHLLLEDHEQAVKLDTQFIEAESHLVLNKPQIPLSNYIQLLQPILEKKISIYKQVLLKVRATKLTAN